MKRTGSLWTKHQTPALRLLPMERKKKRKRRKTKQMLLVKVKGGVIHHGYFCSPSLDTVDILGCRNGLSL